MDQERQPSEDSRSYVFDGDSDHDDALSPEAEQQLSFNPSSGLSRLSLQPYRVESLHSPSSTSTSFEETCSTTGPGSMTICSNSAYQLGQNLDIVSRYLRDDCTILQALSSIPATPVHYVCFTYICLGTMLTFQFSMLRTVVTEHSRFEISPDSVKMIFELSSASPGTQE